MSILRSSVPFALALSLTVACDSGAKDSKPAQVPKTAAKSDSAPAADPHGAPAAANPHGAPPMAGANPHGGMPPMMGGMGGMAPKPAGPPRDITPGGEVVAETLPGLQFSVPSEWEKGTPTSSMRLAQWVLPGPGGDAELVVYRFQGGAGTIEANLTRWKKQFQAPEGKTIDDVSTTKEITGNGLTTSLVDVHGTYVAAVSPGAEEKHDDAGARMLAAIVSGSGDPFYFKAVGPKATMDLWAAPYDTMIASFSGGGAAADPAKPEGEGAAADAAAAAAAAEAKAKTDAKADE